MRGAKTDKLIRLKCASIADDTYFYLPEREEEQQHYALSVAFKITLVLYRALGKANLPKMCFYVGR